VFAMNLEKNTAVNCFVAQCVGEEKGEGPVAYRSPHVLRLYNSESFQNWKRNYTIIYIYIYIYIYVYT